MNTAGSVFTLILADLDHFKALNDGHGHGTGGYRDPGLRRGQPGLGPEPGPLIQCVSFGDALARSKDVLRGLQCTSAVLRHADGSSPAFGEGSVLASYAPAGGWRIHEAGPQQHRTFRRSKRCSLVQDCGYFRRPFCRSRGHHSGSRA
ncbi:hypothetical protein [Arthrobacter bambusae]